MSIHDPHLNQFLPGDTRRPIVLRFAEMFRKRQGDPVA
jgi:hypothetical protein